jgi:CBS domain-containing protein
MLPGDLWAAPASPKRGRTAADIMTADPRTCSPLSTVLETAAIFVESGQGAVAILEGGRPVGVVTDRGLVRALTRTPELADQPVSDLMSWGVVSVLPDDPLDLIREMFREQKERPLVVINPEHQLVGMISWSDLVPHLSEESAVEAVTESARRIPRVSTGRGGG